MAKGERRIWGEKEGGVEVMGAAGRGKRRDKQMRSADDDSLEAQGSFLIWGEVERISTGEGHSLSKLYRLYLY